MVTKIYLNHPLKRVPLNGLVLFDGVFYRRGYANRSTHETQLVRAEDSIYNEISFVPSSSVVAYYKES